ncbi:MAG: DUF3299 domain-containing protein [Phycisphaerales bacterium]|nr:DUF3299 domain-containing protein [Phycisphaerales bacterium]
MRWFWISIVIIGVVAIIMIMQPRERDDLVDAPPITPSTAPPIGQPVIAPDAPAPVAPSSEHHDQFDFKGTGSTTDPYRITWLLMKSAEDPNEPNGEVRIPKNLAQLDGTSIEISGYLAPPVQQETTSELLVMQKRWDGCCIGTPPTPFDCIEVRLDAPVTMRAMHLIQYGTIRGTLRIEPFIAGKFLLGLYRIENGRVEGEISQ